MFHTKLKSGRPITKKDIKRNDLSFKYSDGRRNQNRFWQCT